MEVVEELLRTPKFAGAEYFGVCAHLGHISEFAATQHALRGVEAEFDAVVFFGRRIFSGLHADGRKDHHVLSYNKCAAGSPEFLVQLIGRMGLDIDEAIQLSFTGKVVPLASRCSVHCKSDITHKLNRHQATPADILHTLHDSKANKVAALLEKGRLPLRRVLLIGGVTRNAALLEALRVRLPGTHLIVLPESSLVRSVRYSNTYT